MPMKLRVLYRCGEPTQDLSTEDYDDVATALMHARDIRGYVGVSRVRILPVMQEMTIEEAERLQREGRL